MTQAEKQSGSSTGHGDDVAAWVRPFAGLLVGLLGGLLAVGIAFGELRSDVRAHSARMDREIEIRNQQDAALRMRLDRMADILVVLMARHDPTARWIGELEGRE